MTGVRGLIVAVQFLTRLPTPQLKDYTDDDFGRAAVWFPFVGLIVGAAVAAPVVALDDTPLLAGLVGTVVWVWITGALHVDGLADVADAFGASHRDPARFAEVLKDPHVGTFGVVAVVLQVAAKLVLISELVVRDHGWALVLVPALSRWANLALTRLVPPLHAGLGERFGVRIGWLALGGWGLVLAAASAYVAPALLAVVPITLLAAVYWRKRLGGISGDGHGATIELAETALLGAVLTAALLTA